MNVTGASQTTAQIIEQGADQQVQIVEIHAGGQIPLHSHDIGSSYIVLEGSGRLLGKTERTVKAGDVFYIPANQPHGWTDVSGKTLRFVSVSSGHGIYKKHATASEGEWNIKYA